jgi:type II secretory pathway component PulF
VFESFKSKIADWSTRPIGTLRLVKGPTWRLSTWWPSDSRGAMQQSLLRLLALAHSQRLELIPLIVNLAREHRGRYRRRLSQLAYRLSDGTPLIDALEQTPDVLRDDQVLAMRFAHQTGTLEETYQQLLLRDDSTSNRISANLRQTMLYALATLGFIGLVLMFFIVFIVPTVQKIVSDHVEAINTEVELPWAFNLLSTISHHLSRYGLWWLLGIVAAIWLVCSAPSRQFFRRSLATKLFGSVAQIRSAELLRMLSLAIEAGRPLPAALSTLARYHFDKRVRQQVMFARIEAEHRTDIWNILREAKLFSPAESAAFEKASSNQSQVWMMRRIADWKEDKVYRRREMLASLIRPLVILGLASAVLLIGVAMIGVLAEFTFLSERHR